MVNDLVSGDYPAIGYEGTVQVESDVYDRKETTLSLIEDYFVSILSNCQLNGKFCISESELEKITFEAIQELKGIRPNSPLIRTLEERFQHLASTHMNFNNGTYWLTSETIGYIKTSQAGHFPDFSDEGIQTKTTRTHRYDGFQEVKDARDYTPTPYFGVEEKEDQRYVKTKICDDETTLEVITGITIEEILSPALCRKGA